MLPNLSKKKGQFSLLYTINFRNITGELLPKSEMQQELLISDMFPMDKFHSYARDGT
jgi:hypothetical protein